MFEQKKPPQHKFAAKNRHLDVSQQFQSHKKVYFYFYKKVGMLECVQDMHRG